MREIRITQLKKLIADKFNGEQTALSNCSGVSLSQIGQYLSGYRNMGEKTARKIEAACRKPIGWLDGVSSNPDTPKLDSVQNYFIGLAQLLRTMDKIGREQAKPVFIALAENPDNYTELVAQFDRLLPAHETAKKTGTHDK